MLSLRALRAGALAIAMVMVPAAAHAETLRQALESAYMNNPDLMSALLSVKSAAEDIALRKAGKLPTIGLNADVGAGFAVTNGTSSVSHSYSLGLGYQQTLFDNFKTESQIEQARAAAELTSYALRNAEQNVLLSVVSAYMSVIRDTQLVQAARGECRLLPGAGRFLRSAVAPGRGHQDRRLAGADAPCRCRCLVQVGDRQPADQPGQLSALGRTQAEESEPGFPVERPAADLDRCGRGLGRGPPPGHPERTGRHSGRDGRIRRRQGGLRPDPQPDRLALRHRLLRRQPGPARHDRLGRAAAVDSALRRRGPRRLDAQGQPRADQVGGRRAVGPRPGARVGDLRLEHAAERHGPDRIGKLRRGVRPARGRRARSRNATSASAPRSTSSTPRPN